MIIRCEYNPLIKPDDVKPSREDFCVEGVFNCGVVKYKDQILLLCRVAESVINHDPEKVMIPVADEEDGNDCIRIIEINKNENKQYDYSDSRSIWKINAVGVRKILYLTSISHFRLARSNDGIHFKIDDSPTIMPALAEEAWGIEDPRITKILDTYYITYTAVSKYGAGAALIQTKDFKEYERLGMIFAPENKDVAIFPEKIGGRYYALNRPVPFAIGSPDMWIARSDDLLHWGEQRHFLGVSEECSWRSGRIGGGAVPVKTKKGWLLIYHAADKENIYCLGALLLDLENPYKIIANTKLPILKPEFPYETEGFFKNVVFTCGVLLEEDTLIIYYGASDDKICRADISLEELFRCFNE